MLELFGEISAVAAAAGINPWIAALLVMGLGHLGILEAASPLLEGADLSEPTVVAVLIAALVLEQVADKIPGVDHISDLIHLPVKPAVAAALGVALLIPHLPGDPGAATMTLTGGAAGLVALLTHLGKAGTRVASTATTAGVGSPILSVLEDLTAVGLVVVAVLIPVLALILVGLLLLVAFRGVRALLKRRKNQDDASASL